MVASTPGVGNHSAEVSFADTSFGGTTAPLSDARYLGHNGDTSFNSASGRSRDASAAGSRYGTLRPHSGGEGQRPPYHSDTSRRTSLRWSLPLSLPDFSKSDDETNRSRPSSPAPTGGPRSGRKDPGLERPLLRERMSTTTFLTKDVGSTPCFGIIHRIRRDIKKCIETALTWEQLNSPKLVFSVIQPLQNAYQKVSSPCTIYALLLNRVYFKTQQDTLSSLSVNNTRAMVCELLAVKLVRQLYEEDQSEDGVFRLAILLATVFSPFQGAPKWAIPEGVDSECDTTSRLQGQGNRKISTSALELAIVSEAKRFIRAVPTQRVITDIWLGRIVYSSSSLRYLIKDQYKKRPIMKYDWKNAPLLDHYRLRVPRIRAALEWLHFAILFASYLTVIRTMKKHAMNGYEIFWVIYAFGFALDKFASLMEVGWTVFSSNLWNGLDFVFIFMFVLYLPLRVVGLQIDHEASATEALSILTCAGCVLFPRFAFVTLSDNLLVLSLRSMLAQFSRLMFLAIWCFAGFLVAFVTLGGGKYRPGEILQWMIWIWFGLDSTGLQRANHLHNTLGPVLMVIYACLSNTLIITILVAILSNTFNILNEDALAEQMYRRAVTTFQDVKSDGIFSFQPPINIAALTILWPLRHFIDAHNYHKVIVLFARISNLPLLLVIHVIERYWLLVDSTSRSSWIKSVKDNFSFLGGSRTNLEAVFELEDELDDDALPGGAFAVSDGAMTPDTGRSRSPAPGNTSHSDKDKERRRRAMSMSESGQSTIRARPAILSKLYAPARMDNWKSLEEEQHLLRERLDSIEEGQRRIEEALRGLGGGGD